MPRLCHLLRLVKGKIYKVSHYVILVSFSYSLSLKSKFSPLVHQDRVPQFLPVAEQNVEVLAKRRHFGFALKTLP